MSYSVAALETLQENVVVDGVKRRTQVEENEDDGLALVDGAHQVVGDSDERSLMLPRSFRSPSVKQSLQDRTDIWRNVTI